MSLVRNSITITLSNLPVGFSLSSVTNVRFQYGRGLNEVQLIPPTPIIVVPVPEPSSLTGAAFGIAACLLGLRRATAPARSRKS